MSVFGALVSTPDVEQAVLTVIKGWIDTYLAEVERQASLTVPTISRPASYQATYDFDNWAEDLLPGVLVVCPGTTGTLERQGNATYGGWFSVGVGILVSGQTEAETRTVAGRYQTAIEAAILQHGDLGNFSRDTVLLSKSIRLIDVENRTLALGESAFNVFVDNITDASAGPIGPPPIVLPEAPSPDWPAITSTHVTETDLLIQ